MPTQTAERPLIDPAKPVPRFKFVWENLLPLMVHDTKVAIIEALLYIGHPLSASELMRVLGFQQSQLGTVVFHANSLIEFGVLENAATRKVRGAEEKYLSISREFLALGPDLQLD
jgi:hypothetical protein